MNESLLHFLQHKAYVAPKGYNWIASLHANTWYYCMNNTKADFDAVKHYKLAGIHEGEVGQGLKLEDLK